MHFNVLKERDSWKDKAAGVGRTGGAVLFCSKNRSYCVCLAGEGRSQTLVMGEADRTV